MRTCPWVDEVLDVEVSAPGGLRDPKRLFELFRFVKRVWPLDLEVLVQPGSSYEYVPSRALALFTGAPVRLCWEDPYSGVDTGGGLHTHSLPFPNDLHETDKCFRMLEAMGLESDGRRLATWWTPENARRGEEIARGARNGRRKLVALGLAASEPRKRWPRQRYLDVVRHLAARQAPGVIAYPGERLPLGVIWAAIARCDLYLGNDTGLMHMAAAARIPVVVVIGVAAGARAGTPGDMSQTGPYDTPSRIVRPPAGTPSDAGLPIGLVPVDAVVAATRELVS
jgi:ADP-heptose:LPS heptosyltransferase